MRFLRHHGIYQSDVDKTFQNPAGPTPSRWSGPTRVNRARREDRTPLIVSMSSGRLILDRVARQHCPSPLHRQAQIITHSRTPQSKPDISTWQGIGHFYLALTPPDDGGRCAGLPKPVLDPNPQLIRLT